MDDAAEARALAERIRVDTDLEVRVESDGEGDWWIEVELPPAGDEARAVVHVNEPDDWPWLFETRVRDRLPPREGS